MIKRVFILGLIVSAALAVSDLQASSASANVCYLSLLKEGFYMKWGLSQCQEGLADAEWWWFNLLGLGKRLKGSEYCAEVGSGEKGKYTNSECTTAGEGKFTKAKLALPDIVPALEGGSYPIAIRGTDLSAAVSLESDSGEKLSGEGVLLLLLAPESTALGTLTALYLKVAFEGKACNSSGDKSGEILTGGTFTIVRLSKTSSTIGVLLSPRELTAECSKVKLKMRGPILASLNAGEEATELQAVLLGLSGSGGKQELTKYINYNEEEISARPEINFGTGYLEADEAIGQQVTLLTSGGAMFVIPGR
jgi:hypothetical protein